MSQRVDGCAVGARRGCSCIMVSCSLCCLQHTAYPHLRMHGSARSLVRLIAVAGAPAVQLAGVAGVDTCSGAVDGCLDVAVALAAAADSAAPPPVRDVLGRLGLGSSSTASLRACGGYDWAGRQGCLSGALPGSAATFSWAARIEPWADLRATTCCMWLEGAGVEAFVGLNVGLLQLHVPVGQANVARQVFFRGSREDLAASRAPVGE